MNIEPLSAVRRMGMVARACEVGLGELWYLIPLYQGLFEPGGISISPVIG